MRQVHRPRLHRRQRQANSYRLLGLCRLNYLRKWEIHQDCQNRREPLLVHRHPNRQHYLLHQVYLAHHHRR